MTSRRSTTKYAKEILSDIDTADLAGFLYSRIQKDDDLLILFLARFSDYLKMEEQERYEFLFYKSLQSLKKGSDKLGFHKQGRLSKIYEELGEQVKDAIALKNFVKAFAIIKYGLIFLRLSFSKEDRFNDKLIQVNNKYIDLLHALIILNPPLDLLGQIHEFTLAEIKNEAYISFHPDYNLYEIFNKVNILLHLEQDSFDLLSEIRSDENKRPNNRLHFLISLFSNNESNLLLKHKSMLELQSSEWFKIINVLFKQRAFDKCKEIILGFGIHEYMLKFRNSPMLNLCLEVFICNQSWPAARKLNKSMLLHEIPSKIYARHLEFYPVEVGKLIKDALKSSILNDLNKLNLLRMINDQDRISKQLIDSPFTEHLIPFLYQLKGDHFIMTRKEIYRKIQYECEPLYGKHLQDRITRYKRLFAEHQDFEMAELLEDLTLKSSLK
jgi:hypothetical protein